jgi:hypothetical protein
VDTTATITDLNNNGGSAYYNLQGDIYDWLFYGETRYTNFHYEPIDVIITREPAKQNLLCSNTRILDSAQEINTTSDYAYGADQPTGQQIGILFTPTVLDDYQYFEVLLRQTDSNNIIANDITYELWETAAGIPSVQIGRGKMSSLPVEKSTGIYQWQPVFFPSRLHLSAGTTYALVAFVNGAGSATQALSFGAQSVGSGGTMVYRSRTGSVCGSWGVVPTKDGAIRVYKGWPALPGRRLTISERLGTSLLNTDNIPSWEASIPEDAATPPDCEAIGGSATHWDVASQMWQGFYNAYENRSLFYTQLYQGFGAVSGPTLTSLTKVNQDPLITIGANETYYSGLECYDWTPGAMKGYYRNYYYPSGIGGQYRRLHHASNAHANWSQPGSAGGWQDDGAVTYPWPTVANLMGGKVWKEGNIVYVQTGIELVNNNGTSRTIIAEQDGPLTLKNGKPIYLDMTDMSFADVVANGILGGQFQTSDGYYHSTIAEQKLLTGDSAGTYYFNTWGLSSVDRYIYGCPYPLLMRDAALPNEYLGVAGAGVMSDTLIGYQAVNRYYASARPFVQMSVNYASVTIEIAAGGSQIGGKSEMFGAVSVSAGGSAGRSQIGGKSEVFR